MWRNPPVECGIGTRFHNPFGSSSKETLGRKNFRKFFFSSFFYSLGRAIGTWIQAIAVDMILFGSMYKIYFFFKFIHSWISTHIRAANAGFIGPEEIYRGAQRNWKRKAEKNGDNACGGGPLLRLPRRPCNCEKSTRKRQGKVHVCVCVCVYVRCVNSPYLSLSSFLSQGLGVVFFLTFYVAV